jgi:membrane protein DedA with SNARE-associated domain
VIWFFTIVAAMFVSWLMGYWAGRYSERALTAQVFEESAQEHERLTLQVESLRRQLAAAVVRAVDEP